MKTGAKKARVKAAAKTAPQVARGFDDEDRLILAGLVQHASMSVGRDIRSPDIESAADSNFQIAFVGAKTSAIRLAFLIDCGATDLSGNPVSPFEIPDAVILPIVDILSHEQPEKVFSDDEIPTYDDAGRVNETVEEFSIAGFVRFTFTGSSPEFAPETAKSFEEFSIADVPACLSSIVLTPTGFTTYAFAHRIHWRRENIFNVKDPGFFVNPRGPRVSMIIHHPEHTSRKINFKSDIKHRVVSVAMFNRPPLATSRSIIFATNDPELIAGSCPGGSSELASYMPAGAAVIDVNIDNHGVGGFRQVRMFGV